MLLLGLTGSIATGKSTVSGLLHNSPYNLPVIDADILARKVVEPGTSGYDAIVKHFGPTTADLLLPSSDPLSGGNEDGPTGKGRPLNRPALGRRVFGDSEERSRDRKVLNGIVHPAVRREMWKAMIYYFLTGVAIVVLDIPLLFESGWERYCGTVLVVAVSDPEIQMQRLRARDPHLTAEDAENRVFSQRDIREKARQAEFRGKGRGVVVYNDGDKEDLKREVRSVMEGIKCTSPRWWSWMCLLVPPVGIAAAAWTICRNWLIQRAWARKMEKEMATR